jgi:hypothetical protein
MSAPETPRVSRELVCPTCGGQLRPVSHGSLRGHRFHAEMHIFECPQHGHVFLTKEGVVGPGPSAGGGPSDPSGNGAPQLVPRTSPHAPVAGSVALPEPDSH